MAQDIAKSTYQDNVKENIERLCAGLDEQSVQCVNRILARLKMSYSVKDKRIYRLTSEEKEVLQEIEQEFYPNIIPLKDCYFYNGFFLPKGDLVEFGVSVFWHNHGLTNIKHWDRIADKNIIDVGGFIGDSALILQKYTKAKIYSFEALSDNYDLMLKTIILNKTDKIIPIKKALGAEFDKLKIYKYGSGSSMAIAKSEDYEEVEVITLDSFVQENDIKVGFIKVDIEGFEMPFLQGALETIKAQKPAMLLSIYHQASDFFGIKPFLEDLGLGYKFKVYKPIDRSVSGETCLFCEVDSES
ncbi:FkbM family methyltransferase [Helicobacter sp. MIT 05-5294]|nr:FkbM family methyltransferase [Helicobacter sp. MIT 05-5294]